MTVEVQIPDYEIIMSGSIICVPDKPIIFKVEDLVFELIFKDNSETPEQKLSSNLPDNGKKMQLIFENFNNGLGTGNKEPLKVGIVENRGLFLNYRVYSLSENVGKLIHYTWLTAAEEGGNHGE